VTAALAVVLDETAIVSVAGGNVLASRLIHRAHVESGWLLFAPTCALVEADRTRPGAAEHLAALPAVIITDLDLPAALAVAEGDTWAPDHVRHTARPSVDRPDGAVIATVAPDRWKGQPVRVLDLTP